MARYAVRSEPVRFRAGEILAAGCLYLPKLSGPQPGLLFVQSGGEPDNQPQGMAERLAHVGYVTLAVDASAGALERRLSSAESTARADAVLSAALVWLRKHSHVKDGIAGAIGIGSAGALALRLALGVHPVQAAVSIDGAINAPSALTASARAPLLVIDAGVPSANDPFAEARAVVDDTEAYAAGPHEFVHYANAERGFFDERGSMFRPAEAEDAWSRANKFFYKHLGEPEIG